MTFTIIEASFKIISFQIHQFNYRDSAKIFNQPKKYCPVSHWESLLLIEVQKNKHLKNKCSKQFSGNWTESGDT